MDQLAPTESTSSYQTGLSDLRAIMQDMKLPGLNTSFELVNLHNEKFTPGSTCTDTQISPKKRLEETKAAHAQYLSLESIGSSRKSSRPDISEVRTDYFKRRPKVGEIVISPSDHPHAEIAVAHCVDNRCTSSYEPLGKESFDICSVSVAGHDMSDANILSLAVAVSKGANLILIEAHGGICGAIKMTLNEMEAGNPHQTLTKSLAKGIGEFHGKDTPQIFKATLLNLSAQIGRLLNPQLVSETLYQTTGCNSFYELSQQGKCLVIGAFADFEEIPLNSGKSYWLKRLTFFDSDATLNKFIEDKINAYHSYLQT